MKKLWNAMLFAGMLAVCVFGAAACGSDAENAEPSKAPQQETESAQKPTEHDPLVFENQKKIALWEDVNTMPYHDTEATDGNAATLIPYLVGDGGCVIVIPGGGYVSYDNKKEGIAVAEALNEQGINAFVFRYRIRPYNYKAMICDVSRAVSFVRYYAEDFGINPEKVAVMGFSAGGHLAAMSMEHPGEFTEEQDDIDKMDPKPDMGVLCYPVISMVGENAHQTSREGFLGEDNGDEALAEKYSAELGVTEEMPPCFIWHTKMDKAVPYHNSEMFAEAMDKAGVECELHLYEKGNHGLGLAQDVNDEELKNWFPTCVQWLKDNGITEK